MQHTRILNLRSDTFSIILSGGKDKALVVNLLIYMFQSARKVYPQLTSILKS